ncbi:MAG: flagellar filament capping protein FliD [Desulforhopalus sp.]|nr:flagellar filament capping protein FliD [Desulforhopalus sp.]
MAEISFGGLATGLPTEDLVKSLMAIERKPIDRLEAKKESESIRLKAYAQLNSKLGSLRDAARDLSVTSRVRTTKVQLSSEEAISGTSNGAGIGSYNVAVTQLAQVQKTVTSGFDSDSAAVLGTGYFAIGDLAVVVDSSNNSLQGLAASINSLTDKTGVTASIINDGKDGGNYHLVLTGKDAATSFNLTYDLRNAQNAAIDLDETVRPAQKAIAYIDGIEVVSNSNTLTGVISGVTLNLNKVSEIITPATGDDPPVYATTNLNVVADTEALKEKISTFVSSYNAVMEWIASGYEVKTETADDTTDTTSDTDTKEDSLADYLRGDATVNDVKRKLQSTLSEAVAGSGTLQILSEIGLSTQADGTLLQNSAKLETALQSKFDDVVKLLAGEEAIDGVMKKFNTQLLEITSSTEGMYATKRDRYDSVVENLDLQIAQKEPMMEKIEARIRAQFNAMELLVSSLNSQSSYLTQQMDMLSNLSTGK